MNEPASGTARRFIFDAAHPALPAVDRSVREHYLADEAETVRFLLERARLPGNAGERVAEQAKTLVAGIRERQRDASGLDALLGEYDLSSAEGIVLMCLAEALLRIPDSTTADRLIADKLGTADWEAHLGASESLFVNASTWALLLTGRLVRPADLPNGAEAPSRFLQRLANRIGEPVVRRALRAAMKVLGQQFVMGETIEDALERAQRAHRARGELHSFDMLGEAALTAQDAERYLAAYADAIAHLARAARERRDDAGGQSAAGERTSSAGEPDVTAADGISVKLSALSPRYEPAQSHRAIRELVQRMRVLALAARDANIGLTVDAEEADRLELSLAVFDRVLGDRRLDGYDGLGIAVQAYQKRAWHVLGWLERRAAALGRRVPVRLVKGAYWDTEIKRAQEQGLDGFPVFTRKVNTDVAYLACARRLLLDCPHLYPQLATHNAHTVAWVLEVGGDRPFELQRLHGMGEELYAALRESGSTRRCRVYAPVGGHAHLLPYLVRRLLENGANTSFVNRLANADAPIETIVADPVEAVRRLQGIAHPRIALPRDLFLPERANSRGVNLADHGELELFASELRAAAARRWTAAPRIDGVTRGGDVREQRDPADRRRIVGTLCFADAATAADALAAAHRFQPRWNATPVSERAALLRDCADLLEADKAELVARCVAEGGRTVVDALAEVREAVDLLRYYAAQAERFFGAPTLLPGPTGERNELVLTGRGVFVCVSPWNFPIAIFTGQIAAALAAGNTVIAKPAEQGSITAACVVELFERAGIPAGALQFLPGEGGKLGDALLRDTRVAGVAFTGSVATAQRINRTLAARDGALGTLIAETGGVNAMIVDSSALAEQVVRDAAQSAFNSAGQRCSALRLLCLQEDTADEVLGLLRGYVDELEVGDPALLATDVGPVIGPDARDALESYIANVRGKVLYRKTLDERHRHGTFVAPTIVELDDARALDREVFGPVLHVVRYRAADAAELVDAVNASGFGLTLGVHTRIDSFARFVAARARVGNVYVNRNMIGAQTGVQPFGGMGLSGTGPKAGGPHYVPRFGCEQTVTTNTAAVGGNATLLSLDGLSE